MPDLFLQISDGDPASASDAPELSEAEALVRAGQRRDRRLEADSLGLKLFVRCCR